MKSIRTFMRSVRRGTTNALDMRLDLRTDKRIIFQAMQPNISEFVYDIQLKPGESLSLPKEAASIVGPGHWQVTIRQSDAIETESSMRSHSAFINSYAPEDDGLYDDYPAG
jgi:hypothetical protein